MRYTYIEDKYGERHIRIEWSRCMSEAAQLSISKAWLLKKVALVTRKKESTIIQEKPRTKKLVNAALLY